METKEDLFSTLAIYILRHGYYKHTGSEKKHRIFSKP